jgi:chromate transporter
MADVADALPASRLSRVEVVRGVLLGRWFVRHRDNQRVKAFVAGAAAAAAGALSGAVVVLTREAVTDWATTAIGVVTLAVLLKFKLGEPYLVVAAGVIGLILKLVVHLA